MVHWMIALKGTVRPSEYEIKNLGPAPYNTTESSYGWFVINEPNK